MAIDYEGLKVTGLTSEQIAKFFIFAIASIPVTGIIWVPLLAMWIENQN